MRHRDQQDNETEINPTDSELMIIVERSLHLIRRRSSIFECAECGLAFLVNNQDFHLVTRCDDHRQ